MYDQNGALIGISYQNGTAASYGYDQNRRLKELQVAAGGQTLFGQDYRHDAANNITEIIDKLTNQVKTYQYDQKNQLTMATTPGTFLENEATPGIYGYRAGDYLGTSALDFAANPQAMVSLDYHSSSIGLDFGTTASGVKKLVLTPDAAHNAHRIEAHTIDLYVSSDNLLYTPVSRADWMFVKEDDGTVVITLKEKLATRYLKIHVLFDDRDQDFNPVNKATFLNQLAATLQVYQEGDTRTEEYEYDAEGNRTFARLQLVRTLQYYYEYYPNSNRLKSDGKYEYTYDANGNLITKEKIRRNPSEPEEKWEYTYDLLNRLVVVVKNGSVVAEYGYDPEGYRVVKKARGEMIHYVFEGTEPIY
jgi:YD repeat-containing protein